MKDMILHLPIDQLHDHPRNFFRKLDEDELAELAASINEHGVQHPIVVTPRSEGGYTIISGHQRTRAMRLFELMEAPCVIKQYASDEDAELALIHANTKTRTLSPLEIARSIRREKQIYGKRQGQRSDKLATSGNDCHTFSGRTRELIAKEYGLKPRQIDHYDKLNDLITPLERMIEHETLSATAAYQFACMSKEDQYSVVEALSEHAKIVTVAEAKRLRKEFETKLSEARGRDQKHAREIGELRDRLRLEQCRRDELAAEYTALLASNGNVNVDDYEKRIAAYQHELREAERFVHELKRDLDAKEVEIERLKLSAEPSAITRDVANQPVDQIVSVAHSLYNCTERWKEDVSSLISVCKTYHKIEGNAARQIAEATEILRKQLAEMESIQLGPR